MDLGLTPISLAWCPAINAVLSFTTTCCQYTDFAVQQVMETWVEFGNSCSLKIRGAPKILFIIVVSQAFALWSYNSPVSIRATYFYPNVIRCPKMCNNLSPKNTEVLKIFYKVIVSCCGYLIKSNFLIFKHNFWSEWQSSKSLQTINAGEGVEKREPSYTVDGNVNWYSHYGRQYGDSLKKLGIKPSYDPVILLLGLYPEETKTEKRHMYPNVHCSTI